MKAPSDKSRYHSEFEEKIRQLALERYGKQAAFCKAAGIPSSTFSDVLRKGILNTNVSTFHRIVALLGLNVSEAIEGRFALDDDPNKPVQVPLFGRIEAGEPLESARAEGSFPVPAQLHACYPDAFMLRVEGNSMNEILPDGSLVLVAPCPRFDTSGKLYVVRVGGGKATVKQVELHDFGFSLVPKSKDPTYEARVYKYSDPAPESVEVEVVGRVVWRCSPIASPDCIPNGAAFIA